MKTDAKEYMELLKEIQNSSTSTFTTLPSTEPRFIINTNSREINIPPEFSFLGVQNDHKAETIYFEIDRYFDDEDLATHTCVVQFINKGDDGVSEGTFHVTNMDLNTEGKIVFSWEICNDATQKVGSIAFSVRFYSINKDGYFSYNFNTLPSVSNILETLNVVDKNQKISPSELESWFAKVDNIKTEFNNLFAGAIKSTKSGTNIVTINDVSKVPHDVEVKASIDRENLIKLPYDSFSSKTAPFPITFDDDGTIRVCDVATNTTRINTSIPLKTLTVPAGEYTLIGLCAAPFYSFSVSINDTVVADSVSNKSFTLDSESVIRLNIVCNSVKMGSFYMADARPMLVEGSAEKDWLSSTPLVSYGQNLLDFSKSFTHNRCELLEDNSIRLNLNNEKYSSVATGNIKGLLQELDGEYITFSIRENETDYVPSITIYYTDGSTKSKTGVKGSSSVTMQLNHQGKIVSCIDLLIMHFNEQKITDKTTVMSDLQLVVGNEKKEYIPPVPVKRYEMSKETDTHISSSNSPITTVVVEDAYNDVVMVVSCNLDTESVIKNYGYSKAEVDNKFTEVDNKFAEVDNKFTGALEEVDNKFTGALEEVDNKFTGALELEGKASGIRYLSIYDLSKLDTCVKVRVLSKNRLDLSSIIGTTVTNEDGSTLFCDADGGITASGTPKNKLRFIIPFEIPKEAFTVSISGDFSDNMACNIRFSNTEGSTQENMYLYKDRLSHTFSESYVGWKYCYIEIGTHYNINTNDEPMSGTMYVQIEGGSKVTSYDPYVQLRNSTLYVSKYNYGTISYPIYETREYILETSDAWHFRTDKNLLIEAEYSRDIVKVIEELRNAIISLGGNV